MNKKLISILIVLTFFIGKTGISYALRPMAAGVSTQKNKNISAIGKMTRRGSFEVLEYMVGRNIMGRPEDSYRRGRQRVIEEFGKLESAPEIYSPEFDKILSEKIKQPIPDKIILLLNKLKPYDERWKDIEGENERSERYKDGYDSQPVSKETNFALSFLIDPKVRFEFVRFPAILFDPHFDYLFGFNSITGDLREIFPKLSIGLCNELIDYLKYLDKQNRQKGTHTHLYLEAIVHEALHTAFTHQEARIIARHLFPENYPPDEEIEKSGGLLNKALTTLNTVETIVGYLTRPGRIRWPVDRHAAFGLIGGGMSMYKSDYLAYTPFYKKIQRAVLLFAFSPMHPDLSRQDIPAWLYYCFGSTDDLALAILWAMGNLKDFDKSEDLSPYFQEGAKGARYFEELLARRKENRKEDVKRHFAPSERAKILLTSIRYAESRDWSFFPPAVKEYAYIPIKLLPYMPDLTNEDLRPILLEFNHLLQCSLEGIPDGIFKGNLYPHRIDLSEIILNSLEKLVNLRAEVFLPEEVMATLNFIRRDDRKVVKEKLRGMAERIITRLISTEEKTSKTIGEQDRTDNVDINSIIDSISYMAAINSAA